MSGTYERHGTITKGDVVDVTSLGSGLTLVRKRQVEFTVGEATKFLEELAEFVGDRHLKQNHVDHLVRHMRRGTFHSEWVTLITCRYNGKVYRMNGQHTAWARIEMSASWECPVTLLEYEAKDEEDMRTLYSSIDRGSPRTRNNVIDSYLVGTQQFKDVKRQSLSVLPHGFSLWMWAGQRERSQHDGDDVAYSLKSTHYDLALKVCAFLDNLSPRENKHMFRSPVVAAMFATFERAPQIAREFWSPVADGTGMTQKGDPRLKLRNELLQTVVGLGVGALSEKRKVTQEHMYRLCLAAWNAYREGRPLQILRATEKGKRTAVK